jgi:hypothetical protein
MSQHTILGEKLGKKRLILRAQATQRKILVAPQRRFSLVRPQSAPPPGLSSKVVNEQLTYIHTWRTTPVPRPDAIVDAE